MVCPAWLGYFLASPLRKLIHPPQKILTPLVKEGMAVLDLGCGMGFFSIPLAQMVGPTGKVICVDMQEKMLRGLEKRARKAGVSARIETRLCSQYTIGLKDLAEKIDFALAFAVVHEVPDPASFFAELSATIVPLGKVLLAEPKGHVSEEEFARTLFLAQGQGFTIMKTLPILRSRSSLLQKLWTKEDASKEAKGEWIMFKPEELIGQKVKSWGRTLSEAEFALLVTLTWGVAQLHTDAEYMKTTRFGERILPGPVIIWISF
jgi:2-polyprenyl-3-methyl-5-hydroxy-6-metoxy-1,4-benzoquinol methylase